jgi:ribosomal protein S13
MHAWCHILCLHAQPCEPCAPLNAQGVENKKTYELNEEEINKLRDEIIKYTTESDLVSG